MTRLGKAAAVLATLASAAFAVLASRDGSTAYGFLLPLFESLVFVSCVCSIRDGARPVGSRFKMLGSDRRIASKDDTYLLLMSEHRIWNWLPVSGLAGIGAHRFGANPVWAMAVTAFALPILFKLVDRIMGFDISAATD